MSKTNRIGLLKDDRLEALAQRGNVAQFISFGPGPDFPIRHSRVHSADAVDGQTKPERAIEMLIAASAARSVNVRSFLPERDKGCPFRYGLTVMADALEVVRSLAEQGYYTIVNETVDIGDGGVSGVALGGVVEFAPDATPRVVEEEGTAALPYALACRILSLVYGFEPEIPNDQSVRLEFSIHPRRVGYRRTHTIWWELGDEAADLELKTPNLWPNRFSQHLGDKAYGLVMAHSLGLPVPRTTVIGRRVAPFSFGDATGTNETWLRTCPTEQAPGQYTTVPYWTDPYALLVAEDPSGTEIAAVIAQESVDARWSGASMPVGEEDDFVQGVEGPGDAFMIGGAAPVELPAYVIADVRSLAEQAREVLGPVRLEWAHDGRRVWVVQLHIAKHFFGGEQVLSDGDASEWLDFYTKDGLDSLREIISTAAERGAGIFVHGRIGITSHVGDLLRKAGIPGRLYMPA
jgi:hypothetical protein